MIRIQYINTFFNVYFTTMYKNTEIQNPNSKDVLREFNKIFFMIQKNQSKYNIFLPKNIFRTLTY